MQRSRPATLNITNKLSGMNSTRICNEWDFCKNDALSIDSQNIDPESRTPVHWRCTEHAHKWVESVYLRAFFGVNCPVCGDRELLTGFNDLATKGHADIIAEWHPTKNSGITPQTILFHARDSIHWQCLAQGHEWKQRLWDRTFYSDKGCPICSGTKVLTGFNDVASLEQYEKIVAEWHPTKNKKRTPQKTSYRFTGKLWFQCESNSQHEWFSTLKSRITGSGCLICAAENNKNDLMESLFKKTGFTFAPKSIGLFGDVATPEIYNGGIAVVEADLYNDMLNLVIMFDDEYSYGRKSPNPRIRNNVFSQTIDLLNNGYKVLRIREFSHENDRSSITKEYMKRLLHNCNYPDSLADNYFSIPYKSFDSQQSISGIVETITKRKNDWFFLNG